MKPNNLKFYRQQADGLSQAKLSETVGVTERCYQNYEYGKHLPDVETAQRLAKALGVTVPDLFPLPRESN